MSTPDIMSFTEIQSSSLIDFCKLSPDMDFPPHWLEQLIFQGALQENLTPNPSTEYPLRHFFFEIRNREKLGSKCSLVFGFPAVALSTPDGPLYGPLLYWPLQLEPGANAGSGWVISHEPHQGLHLNPVISAAIASITGHTLPDWPNTKGLKRPSGNELMKWIAEVADLTGLYIDTEEPAARPFDESRHKATPGAIHWSGWLGLWHHTAGTKPPIPIPAARAVPPTGHPLGLLDLDPWQASVFLETRQSTLTVARGISGSGKTHLIAQVITNALSNGQTCLIVSARQPGLREAQALLHKYLIRPRDFLLRDAEADIDNYLAFLKLAIQPIPSVADYPADQFRVNTEKTIRLHQKLDKAYTSSHQPIFGPYNWIECTGLYLQSQQKAGKELLGQQLVYQDFTFTFEEHQQLRRDVSRSQLLFSKAGTLKHPLTALHHAHFVHREQGQSKLYLTHQLQAFSVRAGQLHLRYINTINQYNDKLMERFQTGFHELHQDVFTIKGLLADARNQFGPDFEKASGTWLSLKRLFSRRARQMLEARAAIQQALHALADHYSAGTWFAFDPFSGPLPTRVPAMRTVLESFEQALNDWHRQIPDILQEELRRLSSKSVHPGMPMAGEALEIEQALDVFIHDLNEATILEKPLVNKMLSLPKKLNLLEDISEQLEQLTLNLKDFDTFYPWQQHWLQISDQGRTIVRALVKVKPADWTAAFDSWFYYQCLALHYTTDLPGAELPIEAYAQAAGALQVMIPAQMDALWEAKRQQAIKAIKRKAPKTMRALNKGSQHITLEACWAECGPDMQQLFPVIFATPAVAPLLGTFDYLIVDEAQSLDAATGSALLPSGRQTLVLADLPILPEADQGSFIEALQQHGHQIHELGMVHQVKPGNLLLAAHSAKAVDATDRSMQLKLIHVHGFYRPDTQINEQEAQQVLQLLNQVSLTPQRTLPTIGVVCSTPAQRDLISDYLLRIKQRHDPGTELIQQLERNGLGVFHLGELSGQHFDEVIFSVTIGADHPRQTDHLHTDIFDTPQMTAMLATLMGRSSHKMTALCSIDDLSLRQLAQQPAKGPSLLANFLLYADAFHKADGKQQRNIIERITQQFSHSNKPLAPSAFFPFMAEALRPYLNQLNIVHDFHVNHSVLPLVCQHPSSGTPLTAVWADGSFMNTLHTDWLWEYRLIRALQEKNIPLISVSSTAYWRDGREEIRKLAGTLLNLDHENAD
jgi:hypothetical protein